MTSITAGSAFPVYKAPIALKTLVQYSNDFETEMARLQVDLRTIESPVDALKPELVIEVITARNDQEAASTSESTKSPVYSRYTGPPSSRTLAEAQRILNELKEPSLQRVGSGSFLRRNRNPPVCIEKSQDSWPERNVNLKQSRIEENDDTAKSSGVDHLPAPARMTTTLSNEDPFRTTEPQQTEEANPGITGHTSLIEHDISHTTEGSDQDQTTLAFSQMDIIEPMPKTATCRYIIAFGVVNIASSATTGLTWTILRDDASAGFAIATYMFGVGLAILGSWQSYHSWSNQCTCFRTDSQDLGLLESHVGRMTCASISGGSANEMECRR